MRVEGSVVGFVGVLLSVAFMASTFGLLIATLGKTPEATRGISIFAVLIMVMLGGAWVPDLRLPGLAPEAHAGDSGPLGGGRHRSHDLARPAPGVRASRRSARCSGFSLLFGALAVLRFDWESE